VLGATRIRDIAGHHSTTSSARRFVRE